jgi:hypothetical protein
MTYAETRQHKQRQPLNLIPPHSQFEIWPDLLIKYFIKCRIKRPIFFKDLVETCEFIIEFDSEPIGAPPLTKQLIRFEITPDSLSAQSRDLIPDFRVSGRIDSLVWQLNEPITGEFLVEYCCVPIRSIELQLVRVETFGSPTRLSSSSMRDGGQFSRDATEVQNIQIVDGNPLRNVPISIYMVLPKLFTCPTVLTATFRIGERSSSPAISPINHLS